MNIFSVNCLICKEDKIELLSSVINDKYQLIITENDLKSSIFLDSKVIDDLIKKLQEIKGDK